MNTQYWLDKVIDEAYHKEGREFWLGLSSICETDEERNIKIEEPEDEVGYRRIRIENLTHAVNGVVVNTDDLNFPESLAAWWQGIEQAKYWCVFDGPEKSANLLSVGPLDTPHYIERNTMLTVPAGLLAISIIDYDLIMNL